MRRNTLLAWRAAAPSNFGIIHSKSTLWQDPPPRVFNSYSAATFAAASPNSTIARAKPASLDISFTQLRQGLAPYVLTTFSSLFPKFAFPCLISLIVSICALTVRYCVCASPNRKTMMHTRDVPELSGPKIS